MKVKRSKILGALKISFFIALCLQLSMSFALAAWPTEVLAQVSKPLQFEPQIQIPESSFSATSVKIATFDEKTGTMNSDLLARYIQAFYNYGMAVVGILAAIVLMAGGVLWLTSGGDSGKVGQAKELIIGSIVGTGILFSSWIILNTINPELLKFAVIKTITVEPRVLDGDDGIIDDLKNVPQDTKYAWVCVASRDFDCTNGVNPPSINMNLEICRTGQPINSKPTNCPYGQLWCCGQSEADRRNQDSVCPKLYVGAGCKMTMTSLGNDGWCENDKCNPCKRTGESCSGYNWNMLRNSDWECIGRNGYHCGMTSDGKSLDGAACSCAIGGGCTCKLLNL